MQSPATQWVNPEILRWARTRLKLSPEEVEKQSKKLDKPFQPISVADLNSWESKVAEPSLEQLETLAEIFVCPLGFFFLEKPPSEEIRMDFRGLARGRDKVSAISEQTLHRFFDQIQWVTELINSTGVDWSADLGRADLKEDSVMKIVERERARFGFNANIRKTWTKPTDSFEWWRRKIENLGIFCFVMKLGPQDIRGASLWVSPCVPAILVNHEDLESHTGRAFTLLHEYCHLLLKRPGFICDFSGSGEGSSVETYANKFAAHILLNQKEFAAQLDELGCSGFRQEWGDSTLDEIREPFFVSRHVIAIRLEEMGLAPRGFYNLKKAQWERRKPFARGGSGKRTTKVERKLREIGFSMAKLLSNSSLEERVPKLELSYVLEMKIKKTDEFLSWLRNQKLS